KTDIGEAHIRLLVRDLESAYARQVCLVSEDLKVKQHFDVFRKRRRNTRGPLYCRILPRRLLLRELNAPFHVANSVEIFIELRAVTRSKLGNEPRRTLRNQVENAASFPDSRELLRGV